MNKKQKIIDHLNMGYAITAWLCHDIAGSSGDRALRKIVAENRELYQYIWVNNSYGSNYKAWFLKKKRKQAIEEVSFADCYCYKINIKYKGARYSKGCKYKKDLRQLVRDC